MITTKMLLEGFTPLYKMLFITVVIVIILTLLKALFFKKKKLKLEYTKHNSLLTNHELKFYRLLKPISDHQGYTLMSKVRMADIIRPKKGTKNYMALFAKISQKHVDFLLCDKVSLEPLLAIELDDKTHDKADRQERDKFINEAYRLAKLPILHVRDSVNLESKILKSISK